MNQMRAFLSSCLFVLCDFVCTAAAISGILGDPYLNANRPLSIVYVAIAIFAKGLGEPFTSTTVHETNSPSSLIDFMTYLRWISAFIILFCGYFELNPKYEVYANLMALSFFLPATLFVYVADKDRFK